MTSIHTQLTRWLAAVLVALSLLAGTALYLFLRNVLVEEFDQSLLARAHALQAVVTQQASGHLDVDVNLKALTEYKGPGAQNVFRITTLDGGPIIESSDVRIPPSTRRPGRPWDVTLPGGTLARAASISFQPPPDPDEHVAVPATVPAPPTLLLTIARDRGLLDWVLLRVGFSIGLATLLLSTAVVLASALIVRRGLSPLRSLAAEVAAIDFTQPDASFTTQRLPRELQTIAERMNELLQRVSRAFARERQFTAAVSHELRTPIAELRSAADIAAREPDNLELAHRAVMQSQEIAQQMQTMVSTLLAIARQEAMAGRTPLSVTPVVPIIHRALVRRKADLEARRITASLSVPDETGVLTNAELFDAVLDNLISNAARYATEGGTLGISVSHDNGSAIVSFENPQSDLGAQEIEHVFQPFWRKDAARTDGEHVGLGLSLVRAYCAAMGAVAVATRSSDGAFVLAIRFPDDPENTRATRPEFANLKTPATIGGTA